MVTNKRKNMYNWIHVNNMYCLSYKSELYNFFTKVIPRNRDSFQVPNFFVKGHKSLWSMIKLCFFNVKLSYLKYMNVVSTKFIQF